MAMLYPDDKHSRAGSADLHTSGLYPPLFGESERSPLGVRSSRVQTSSTRFFWSCDNGEVVEGYREYHIGTNTPVDHLAVNIVVEITILVEESIEERLLGKFGCLEELLLIFSLPANSHREAQKQRALYHKALNSTMYPVRGTTGCPLAVEFIHVTALSLPSGLRSPLGISFRLG